MTIHPIIVNERQFREIHSGNQTILLLYNTDSLTNIKAGDVLRISYGNKSYFHISLRGKLEAQNVERLLNIVNTNDAGFFSRYEAEQYMEDLSEMLPSGTQPIALYLSF